MIIGQDPEQGWHSGDIGLGAAKADTDIMREKTSHVPRWRRCLDNEAYLAYAVTTRKWTIY